MTLSNIRKILGVLMLALLIAYGSGVGLTGSLVLEAEAQAQTGGNVPGNWSGSASDAQLWRAIRRGVQGTSSVRDQMAGQLVQSDGDSWRAFRNGTLSQIGGWSMLAIIIVLAVFRLVRGQVKIESGLSGQTIERFSALERATHWLTASSFILLAVTGLNVLYGKYFLLPIIGQDAFASLAYYGKLAHNYVGFAFMVGLVLMFVQWVRANLLDGTDLNWVAKGGGLLSAGSHPPARKFNFGQKCVFWIVIFGGTTLSVSGLALLFPFEITPWGETFAAMNVIGFSLPADLTPLQETQLSALWHGLTAVIMIAVIIAHIYIGSPLGMEGAIGAVGSGQVDVNWAKEHHSLWAAEVTSGGGGEQPAE